MYADLIVELVSVQKINGETISFNNEEKCFEVNYGDEFIVSAKVKTSNVVNKALLIESESNTSINKIASYDTSARFKASAPSRGEKYKIKISSVETAKASLDVYFKVLLPVSEIDISDNLGVAVQKPLNLNSQVVFKSDYDVAGNYEVDKKGVSFEIAGYIDETNNPINVLDYGNGEYKLVNSDSLSFKLENNNLFILDTNLDGKINIIAKSEMYKENLEEELQNSTLSDVEKNALIASNQRLMVQTSIEIVKPITLRDISFVSGQTIFDNYDDAGTRSVKLDARLYNYPIASYYINNTEYSYNSETIDFTVMSREQFDVSAVLTSMFVGNDEYKSTQDVIRFGNSNITLIKQGEEQVGKTTSFKILADKAGTGYLDFVVKFRFDNEISYSFGELYNQYLASLENDDYSNLTPSQKNTRVVVNVCSLAKEINIKKDDVVLQDNDNIIIFDKYSQDNKFSSTKFLVDLGVNQGINTVDKTIRVYITPIANINASQLFEIKDDNGNIININTLSEESSTIYYFDLDLSNNFNGVFYVKAVNLNNEESFVFSFDNIINSRIIDRDGVEIVPNVVNSSTLMGVSKEINVTTKKGVSNIQVKTITQKEDGSFEFYNLVNSSNEIYSKIVLQNNDPSGALVAFYYDANLNDEITISGYDSSIISVNSNINSDVQSYFNDSYDPLTHKLSGVIGLVGLKNGSTKITFTANNGFSVTLNVLVVGVVGEINLQADDSKYGKVLTEKELNASSPYVSAIYGGKFDVSVSAGNDMSGIESIVFASLNEDILSINNNGQVFAKSSGTGKISVTIKYYKFKGLSSGSYYMWTKVETTKTFDVKVFVPAKVVSLSSSKIRVFDYNSLAYDETDKARISLRIIVEDGNATILQQEYRNNFRFYLQDVNDQNYFSSVSFDTYGSFYGLDFSAYALLGVGANTDKTIKLLVEVNEFGIIRDFSCEIQIIRPVKVQEIGLKATIAGNDLNINNVSDNLYTMRVKNGQRVELTTNIDDFVENKNLVVFVNKENSETNQIGDYDTSKEYAYISKNGIDNYTTSLVGNDIFTLVINATLSGPFYLTIIAKDSYVDETHYNMYISIRVIIEDGNVFAYSIKNYEELKAIENDPNANYQLVNNIDLPYNWQPIANFGGVLNGNNYTISNLSINQVSSNNVGLFKSINYRQEEGESVIRYGTVYDLRLEANAVAPIINNLDEDKDVNIGVLAGVNDGIVFNVSVKFNTIKSNIQLTRQNIGGIVGVNNGILFNFPISLSYDNDEERNNKYFTDSSSSSLFTSSQYTGAVASFNSYNYDYANFATGNIVVLSNQDVYVGGLVGANFGSVNGFYNAYNNYISGASGISFATSYQNYGVDAIVNINATEGNIGSANSSIGGIAGYNEGYISNVGVEGKIGKYDFRTNTLSYVYNNIGGIVGYNGYKFVSDAIKTVGYIKNSYASVNVSGQTNVGGAVGLARGYNEANMAIMTDIVVENYSSNNNNLIVGGTNVGGLVGSASYCQIANSYSYGYTNKFDTNYADFGDMFVYDNDAVAGGLVGLINNSVNLNNNFSTFNIVAYVKQNENVRGLVGNCIGASSSWEDNFYIGVIDKEFDDEIDYSTLDLLGIDDCKFYYLLAYRDKNDLTQLDAKNCFICLYNEDEESSLENVNITFEYYNENSIGTTISKYSDLLGEIPTEIVVEGIGTSANVEESEIKLVFNPTTNQNNIYKYSFTNEESETSNVLVVGLSKDLSRNTFRIRDLFQVKSTTPTVISKINLIVNDLNSSNGIVTINNTSEITVNKVGQTTLRFLVKENSNVYSDVKLLVVNNFDELLISENISFSTSIFNYTLDNPMAQRLNTDFNLNSSLVEIVGGKEEQIKNQTNYTVEYSIYYREGENREGENEGFNVDALATGKITLNNRTAKISVNGYYKFVVSVVFVDQDNNKYRFTSNDWVFYVNAYASALAIGINESEVWVDGINPVDNLVLFLYSNDTSAAPELTLLLDIGQNDPIQLKASHDEQSKIYTYSSDLSPFIIEVKPNDTLQGDAYFYIVKISVKDTFKKVTNILEYFLKIYDKAGYLENDYTEVLINLVPANLESVATAHYAYTEQVSQLAGVTNTVGNDRSYFYSYLNEKHDSIVAGYGGLFVIDLYPYYSNITSISITSSLGSSGSALTFVQMVTVKDADDANREYFVYAPTDEVSEVGSLNLRLISSMPEAKITVTNGIGVLSGKTNKYSFESVSSNSGLGTDANIDKGVGRLYVRTIAPSSLSEVDNFDIIVTIKYKTLDENDNLVERVRTLSHNLSVHSVPGMTFTTTHDGKERNVIAYTGNNSDEATRPDWIDVTPIVDNNYDYTMTYNVVSSGTEQGPNVDYALLTQVDDKYILTLGPNAQVGDIINLILQVEINYDNYVSIQTIQKQIEVVNVVIESLSIRGIDENDIVNLSISSSKQLLVSINGFGLLSDIALAENQIARAVDSVNGLSYYWFRKDTKTGSYITLNSQDTDGQLPFVVYQINVDNSPSQSIIVNKDYSGVISGESQSFNVNYKAFYVEGYNKEGKADLRISTTYVYKESRILFIPLVGEIDSIYDVEFDFTINVFTDENDENLVEIENEEDLRTKLREGGNYILTNDITISSHTPIEANFASFDGNNKVITIENFYYSQANSNYDTSINLGLFSKVNSGTIIKNLIVALPNNKNSNSLIDLSSYSTVNFGIFAAENEGLITNCDVIALNRTLEGVSYYLYTIKLQINSSAQANIGGFVGSNSGIITNCRVGRDEVDVYRITNSQDTIYRQTRLQNVANKMIISVDGAGYVGGFVSSNSGTISSSYAKNLQLEVYASTQGSTLIRTAGFVVTNNGYV